MKSFFETQSHRDTEGVVGWKLDGFSRALRGLCASVFLKVRARKAGLFCGSILKYRVTEAQREGAGFGMRSFGE